MNKQLLYIEEFFCSEQFALLTKMCEGGDERAIEVLEELTITLDSAHYFLKQKNKERTDYEIRKMQEIIKKIE